MDDQLVVKLSAERKKELNGVMDEYLTSITRETTVKETESEHRKEMLAIAVKNFDIPKNYMKTLLDIHAKEKKRQDAEVTSETLDLYEVLRESANNVQEVEVWDEDEEDEAMYEVADNQSEQQLNSGYEV